MYILLTLEHRNGLPLINHLVISFVNEINIEDWYFVSINDQIHIAVFF